MTIASNDFQKSFKIAATSLFHINQSTASSLRAMKLSRLLAPPKTTFRMLLSRGGLFQALRFFFTHAEETGARAHLVPRRFHARSNLVKALVEGFGARTIADQIITALILKNLVEPKFVLVADQEPARLPRYRICAITPRLDQP